MRRFSSLFSLLLAILLIAAACSDDQSTQEEDQSTQEDSTSTAAAAATFTPATPECVAPADAGGGWDFTCRSIGGLFESLGVTGNVVVTNQPGGGGGVAFSDVAANRNDSNDLVIAASPATAIRFAQNQYTGLEADQFRWIGAIGADFGVVSVKSDSQYTTLDELVTAVQADPTAVIFGGGSPVGGQDHFKVLLLAQEMDVDPAVVPWVAYDGGGEAQNALLGDEIEVFTGDVSETFGNEDLRILAVMADERIEGVDAPTTVELGYDMVFPIWRGLVAPGGMSDEAYDFWVDALGQVEASDDWAVARAENGLSPLRLLGDEFQAFAFDAVADFRTLSEPFDLVAP